MSGDEKAKTTLGIGDAEALARARRNIDDGDDIDGAGSAPAGQDDVGSDGPIGIGSDAAFELSGSDSPPFQVRADSKGFEVSADSLAPEERKPSRFKRQSPELSVLRRLEDDSVLGASSLDSLDWDLADEYDAPSGIDHVLEAPSSPPAPPVASGDDSLPSTSALFGDDYRGAVEEARNATTQLIAGDSSAEADYDLPEVEPLPVEGPESAALGETGDEPTDDEAGASEEGGNVSETESDDLDDEAPNDAPDLLAGDEVTADVPALDAKAVGDDALPDDSDGLQELGEESKAEGNESEAGVSEADESEADESEANESEADESEADDWPDDTPSGSDSFDRVVVPKRSLVPDPGRPITPFAVRSTRLSVDDEEPTPAGSPRSEETPQVSTSYTANTPIIASPVAAARKPTPSSNPYLRRPPRKDRTAAFAVRVALATFVVLGLIAAALKYLL